MTVDVFNFFNIWPGDDYGPSEFRLKLAAASWMFGALRQME